MPSPSGSRSCTAPRRDEALRHIPPREFARDHGTKPARRADDRAASVESPAAREVDVAAVGIADPGAGFAGEQDRPRVIPDILARSTSAAAERDVGRARDHMGVLGLARISPAKLHDELNWLDSHIGGKPRTPTLKVSIGCTEGFIGEDMFFYAGPGALRRAELAKKILEERFKIVKLQAEEIRIDYLGLNAIHGAATPADAPEPYEVAVRVAARTKTREEAAKVGREIDGMAVSGVAHTGKRVPHQDRTREVIGVWSSLVAREKVFPSVNYFVS